MKLSLPGKQPLECRLVDSSCYRAYWLLQILHNNLIWICILWCRDSCA